ncbi:hypothetical protein HN020_02760 [Brevibacillus borstelensis]|uniref:hypothetical protein n=1 Tax=Brevibacillus borstelensis TaxID=45462 RepID=UPI001490134D|nr:hypothetical protein [Brevibacillus borstelensis]NOU53724.1 hypothetical protein [Brevibacillus borstelensis]
MLEKSYLVPKKEGQLLNCKEWDEHTSEEHKWELWEGIPFSTEVYERDRLAICLIYSMGLEYFVNELLPDESKVILLQLLQNTIKDDNEG